MVGREAVSSRIVVDVGNPKWRRVLDQRSEETVPFGKWSDGGALFRADAGRDEPENSSLVVGYAKGGILALNQFTCRVHNILENTRKIERTRDGRDGGIGRVELTHASGDLL